MEKKKRKKRMPRDMKHQRAKLIREYYDSQGMTLEAIGRLFGITKERTRQILNEEKK